MTPTEARALAEEARARGMSSIDSVIRSLADQVEALQGQTLSSIEREEYFSMKKDAERYRWLCENKHVPWSKIVQFEFDAATGIDDAIDRAREAT